MNDRARDATQDERDELPDSLLQLYRLLRNPLGMYVACERSERWLWLNCVRVWLRVAVCDTPAARTRS